MTPLRIAIIDDDPFVAAHLKIALAERLPSARLFTIEEPVAPAGYDVYVIDNDFGGRAFGGELHDRVRAVAPDALILGYSAELDTGFLRRLMRGGVRDAYDKESPADRDALVLAIVEEQERRRAGQRRGSLPAREVIRAVADLLREWNLRLNARISPEAGE
ncbi:MAG: hypothetical protein V2J24_02700 [Pseudomonadales bacterium]|jgi:DNA-binding NarL/FixJ family response regulator|nr:hypothetical protein [Pseudomonadales bacterium]